MIGWSDTSGTASLTYDFENRLASFVTSSVTANYLYDPQGRRLQKTVNSVVTRYLWDGATMIAELDGTNQITRLYTYNPQSMEPVSTAIGCTAYFYITDHLMTPQILTSISGTTVWYANYSAFGVATIITDTVTNNLRFPGQYVDAESGLYYNYARYYLPQMGRYAEQDPILQLVLLIQVHRIEIFNAMLSSISFKPQFLLQNQLGRISMFNVILKFFTFNPEQLQEYTYVQNNPLSWFDSLGMDEDSMTTYPTSPSGSSTGGAGGSWAGGTIYVPYTGQLPPFPACTLACKYIIPMCIDAADEAENEPPVTMKCECTPLGIPYFNLYHKGPYAMK